jgi:L,D-peptidoglycan transpeptidase YkuD (ErfK/YbiS/YcfS/YnhG family)
MELVILPQGVAYLQGQEFTCALGRSGVSDHKLEGDGATPSGIFGLRNVLYRADRVAAPDTLLPIAALSPQDGWCDAPDDPDYNRRVVLPHRTRCESLWRDDHIYDLIAVTNYNEAPATPGKGSAIFMHIARDGYTGTEGCIAFSEPDLRLILAEIGPQDIIRVRESS